MKEFNPYAYWLSDIKGIGNATIRVLLKKAYGAEDIYHMSENDIRMCLSEGINRAWEVERKGAAICAAKCLNPVEEAEKLKEKGISFRWFFIGDGAERERLENAIGEKRLDVLQIQHTAKNGVVAMEGMHVRWHLAGVQ